MPSMTDWALFSRPLKASQLVNYAARLFARAHEPRLRGLGLGFAQVPVLAALADGAALSQKELTRRARIEQPSMAQTLARMERDGLVRREPDPDDKRSSRFALTEAALARLPEAHAALLRGNAEALAGFSDHEVELLNSLLLRLTANLERATSDSPQ